MGFGSLVAEGEEGKEGVLGMAGDVGGGVGGADVGHPGGLPVRGEGDALGLVAAGA